MRRPEDDGFIFKNWISGLKACPPWRHMRYGEFSRQQAKVIEELLHRPGVEVMVAVEEQCGEPKFGFICYEWRDKTFVLHYIYIRKWYREKKIATRLLKFAGVALGKTPVVASSWTKALSYHQERWNIDWNFFAAWSQDATANHKDLC